jgi:hypothetical protein
MSFSEQPANSKSIPDPNSTAFCECGALPAGEGEFVTHWEATGQAQKPMSPPGVYAIGDLVCVAGPNWRGETRYVDRKAQVRDVSRHDGEPAYQLRGMPGWFPESSLKPLASEPEPTFAVGDIVEVIGRDIGGGSHLWGKMFQVEAVSSRTNTYKVGRDEVWFPAISLRLAKPKGAGGIYAGAGSSGSGITIAGVDEASGTVTYTPYKTATPITPRKPSPWFACEGLLTALHARILAIPWVMPILRVLACLMVIAAYFGVCWVLISLGGCAGAQVQPGSTELGRTIQTREGEESSSYERTIRITVPGQGGTK